MSRMLDSIVTYAPQQPGPAGTAHSGEYRLAGYGQVRLGHLGCKASVRLTIGLAGGSDRLGVHLKARLEHSLYCTV